MPGARCTRGPVCAACAKKLHTSIQVSGEYRHPLRNGFTAYIAISPVSSCVTVIPEKH